MTPLVSVYLPTRNRSGLLREAALSVLAQTFRDIELIIVDDASDDETPDVSAKIAAADRRVKVIRSNTPLGPCAARNLAIDASTGDFVTGVDDDDLMLPDRLRSLLKAAGPRHSLICSSFFLERGSTRRILHRGQKVISLKDMLHYNFVGNQALVRRQDVVNIGAFDVSLPASEDYDLWTRLIERTGPALRIASPTYVKREIPGSGQLTLSARFVEGAIRYTDKHKAKMTSAQFRSQNLILLISKNEPIYLSSLSQIISWRSLPMLLRYIGSRATKKMSRK